MLEKLKDLSSEEWKQYTSLARNYYKNMPEKTRANGKYLNEEDKMMWACLEALLELMERN